MDCERQGEPAVEAGCGIGDSGQAGWRSAGGATGPEIHWCDIGTATASAEFEKARSFRIDARLPPILHFYETLDSFMFPDFGLLHRLHRDSLELVPTGNLHHIHFTTYGFVARDFPAIAKLTHATPATWAAAVGLARQTGAFLQRMLHPPE